MEAKRLLLLLVALALCVFMRGDTAVLAASPDLANGHFQLMAAVVDEPNADLSVSPVHEVFLLNTETGKVWKFEPLHTGRDKDGASRILSEPYFAPIQVGFTTPKQ